MRSQLIINLLFPSLFLLFSFKPVKNIGTPNLPVIKKELKVESAFQHIRIDGNISLVITNEPAGTVMLEGIEKDVNQTRYRVKNNKLIIHADRSSSDEFIIYLSVATLKSMMINGDGHISSTCTIKAENLHLWLDGNITVKMYAIGKVSVDAFNRSELRWESLFNQSLP